MFEAPPDKGLPAGSSIVIGNPGAGIGTQNSQANAGAAMGAAQGAAAGAMVGSVVPVIGTAVGAVIGGVVGAVAGWLGGGQMDQATKHKKKAAKWAEAGQDREAALQRAQMLRAYRAARADAIVNIGAEAGGTQGSATGAVSSLGAQYAFGDAFFGGQVRIQKETARHLRKAGKAANKAGDIFGYMDAAASLASTFGSYGLNFGSSGSVDMKALGATSSQSMSSLSGTGSGFDAGYINPFQSRVGTGPG